MDWCYILSPPTAFWLGCGNRSITSPMSKKGISRSDERSSGRLAGKTCLVTGSSRGIGSKIAHMFGAAGADVVVHYCSSATAAEEVVTTIAETDGEGTARSVQADVSDADDVSRMARQVRHAVGSPDVLVNNAGVTADATFESMTREQWEEVIDVNLGGTFNCTKAFFEDIREAEQGRIINVASIVGQQGNVGQANYAASKSALFGLTRTLALELAETGSTANCIAPGFTETDMVSTVPDHVREKITRKIPLDRFADPGEIAGMVGFLASDESSYMTGQVVDVNGGMA